MRASLTLAALLLTTACKIDGAAAPAVAEDATVTATTSAAVVDPKAGGTATTSQTPTVDPNLGGSTTVTVTDLPNPSVQPVDQPHTPPIIYSPTVVQPSNLGGTNGIITIPDPTPAPAPASSTSAGCASLTNPAWAAAQPIKAADAICTAVMTCDSVWKGDASIDANATLPTVTAGRRYYVTPLVGDLLPAGYSGTAVGAVPVDDPVPTTKQSEFDVACFQAG